MNTQTYNITYRLNQAEVISPNGWLSELLYNIYVDSLTWMKRNTLRMFIQMRIEPPVIRDQILGVGVGSVSSLWLLYKQHFHSLHWPIHWLTDNGRQFCKKNSFTSQSNQCQTRGPKLFIIIIYIYLYLSITIYLYKKRHYVLNKLSKLTLYS